MPARDFASNVTRMEVGQSGGLPENDFVAFQRGIQFNSGQIVIDVLPGFMPGTVQLFDFGGFGFSGPFPSVVVNGPFGASVSPDGLSMTFSPATVIPLPSTVLMALPLLAGLVVIHLIRKRRQMV